MNLLHWTLASGLLAAILPLAACGNGGLKWTEDVLLPDGRTVTLTRYQEFKGPSRAVSATHGVVLLVRVQEPGHGQEGAVGEQSGAGDGGASHRRRRPLAC